tara:strand:+ start:86 stop:595 length:510 start_codon:yes stop_codon:yes gene_type:complete
MTKKMTDNDNDNHLKVDIYYDKYPSPKFVGINHVDEVSRVDVAPTTSVLAEPTTVVVSAPAPAPAPRPAPAPGPAPASNVLEGDSQTKTNPFLAGGLLIGSTLICIGIGVMCIVIALEENEPNEEYMIKLEGNIIYVFYLGVSILFCVGLCLCGVICAQCTDVCLVCCN